MNQEQSQGPKPYIATGNNTRMLDAEREFWSTVDELCRQTQLEHYIYFRSYHSASHAGVWFRNFNALTGDSVSRDHGPGR